MRVFTYVVLVGLQGSLQCDRQLLIDLVNSCLDFHLDAPLCCFDTILPTAWHRLNLSVYPTHSDLSERKRHRSQSGDLRPGSDEAARSPFSALQFPPCQGQNSQPETATGQR